MCQRLGIGNLHKPPRQMFESPASAHRFSTECHNRVLSSFRNGAGLAPHLYVDQRKCSTGPGDLPGARGMGRNGDLGMSGFALTGRYDIRCLVGNQVLDADWRPLSGSPLFWVLFPCGVNYSNPRETYEMGFRFDQAGDLFADLPDADRVRGRGFRDDLEF